MSQAELIEQQHQETRMIIEELLADGSDPDALYTIEHHLCADTFEALEDAAVEAFKMGFDVAEAEELELEEGGTIVCFDAVMETALNAERIDEQVEKLVALADKHNIDYDGWGTYFESSEEEGPEGE
ncbi:ribonuclease E inhibitor B [Salinivibrio kushneri]|uniref:Regulator of ribonuclease activity B n=1 Tax=Salinivibrio kushneri TaxID=1908198 RepID=A0AB36JZ02_9GAMM|nr:ribonuclease E inhibitor RraB [Salinivibrio kushneri]OOE36602.1 ribonuclease E inhibitor B [Salinivibrio kushneri]OOE40313.1 ribonuclease E inhibitor B [Salinivibrio kushneri]QCP01276.1 ribonuclease E inhibitor RraB [Salinivibrio kushneri]